MAMNKSAASTSTSVKAFLASRSVYFVRANFIVQPITTLGHIDRLTGRILDNDCLGMRFIDERIRSETENDVAAGLARNGTRRAPNHFDFQIAAKFEFCRSFIFLNNAYIYECPGKNNPNGYDLSSMGPDGRAGGDDDITNWQQASN